MVYEDTKLNEPHLLLRLDTWKRFHAVSLVLAFINHLHSQEANLAGFEILNQNGGSVQAYFLDGNDLVEMM